MATRVEGKFEASARLTPANAITLLRILAAPVVIFAVADLGVAWTTVVLWVALASTDFVDGWVARRHGTTTSGAFLDPLADKVLVLGALGALAADGRTSWIPVLVIAARELAVSAYRSVVSRGGISVPARTLAKAKTMTQDLAITLLVLPGVGDRHPAFGRDLLWIAVVLAVASALQYVAAARRRPAV